MKTTASFGSWPSPIAASALTKATVGLSEPRFDGDFIYWLESRPEEKGRTTIVRRLIAQGTAESEATPETLIPVPINVRSRVNEYGGGSYCIEKGIIYFVLADDQRIYRLNPQKSGGISPEPITPAGTCRYGDLIVDTHRNRLLAICEDHGQLQNDSREPTTYVISISLSDDSPNDTSAAKPIPQNIISGSDFYSSLDISPCGNFLCWLSWNHPNMPWENCECWIGTFDKRGNVLAPKKIAGNGAESIFQPQWSPDGRLFYVSDRNNWWNLYRHSIDDQETVLPEIIIEKKVEFATPQWVFGLSTFDFLDSNTIACCFSEIGYWHLAVIDVFSKQMQAIDTHCNTIGYLRCDRNQETIAFLGAAGNHLGNLYTVDAQAKNIKNSKLTLIAQATETTWPNEDLSKPHAIAFQTPISEINSSDNNKAYAFFYPPNNAKYCGPEAEKPPLIVLCHGGPTASTNASLNLKIQFWSSRGFAVVDLNYRGSTGYGRKYRQQLNKNWGITDVEDAAAAVHYLAQQQLINTNKVAIKGSSAGGYTVLAALTFTDIFSAGASLYGIGDLETLALDTHKFESRYMDTLVGPYPEQKQLYQKRSPINAVEKLNCPVIFFQGLEDNVVPPNQAQTMVNALDKKKIPVAYVEFPDEGHGFRQATNIIHAIEAELYFYSRIFKFSLSDDIEPVAIRNLGQDEACN